MSLKIVLQNCLNDPSSQYAVDAAMYYISHFNDKWFEQNSMNLIYDDVVQMLRISFKHVYPESVRKLLLCLSNFDGDQKTHVKGKSILIDNTNITVDLFRFLYRPYPKGSLGEVEDVYKMCSDRFKFVIDVQHALNSLYDGQYDGINALKSIADWAKNEIAARKIQTAFKRGISDPHYSMCLKRLKREFSEMLV